jgi:hypothetical protein
MLLALLCIKSAGDGAGEGPSLAVTISVSPGSIGGIFENMCIGAPLHFGDLHFIAHLGLGHAPGSLHSHLQTGWAQT